MIKLADRLLKKGKGKLLFFAASLAKLLIITGAFYLLSRFRSDSIVYFIQGLSVIILAALLEGVRLLFRSVFHGA
jgi:hypothetical protein